MSHHPIEALLRPPVELWTTLVALAAATTAVLAPWSLMMPPGVGYGAGAVLAALAVHRARVAAAALPPGVRSGIAHADQPAPC